MDCVTAIKTYLLRICTIHNRKYEPGLELIWLEDLEHLTEQEIFTGIDRMRKEYKGSYMPTPGMFIEVATKSSEGDIQVEAEQAWMQIDKALRRYGSSKTIAWENPACAEWVRNTGGWRSLGLITEDELNWKKKEFIKQYPTLRQYKQTYSKITHSPNSDPMVFVGNHSDGEKVQLQIENKQKRSPMANLDQGKLKLIMGTKQ